MISSSSSANTGFIKFKPMKCRECGQEIPIQDPGQYYYEAEELKQIVENLSKRIGELENENARLKRSAGVKP